MNPITVVIDGNHCLHRVLHVKEFDLSHNGSPTGGIFGFVQVLRNVLTKFSPDRCIITWDCGIPEHRKRLCPGYKANRQSAESDPDKDEHRRKFAVQKPVIRHVTHRLGCRNIEWQNYEGDDIIAGVAGCTKPSEKVIIVSEDMDLAQLVASNVSLYRPTKDLLVDTVNFEAVAKAPNTKRFVLRKAICGDTSDNIDGVAGIGDGRGTTVVKEAPVDTLDAFFEWCSSHKSVPVKRISEFRSLVEANLAVVDLPSIWKDYSSLASELSKPVEKDFPAVVSVFSKIGFRSIVEASAHWLLPFNYLR